MKDVDPIEELHRIRWQICKKAGGTPADYFRYYYERDKKIFGESSVLDAATYTKALRALQRKPRRKSAKPAVKASARKTGSSRKAVTT